ncbi:MAG: phosphatase PAP2 family protein [Bdellovibrionota bacterium]
MTNLDKKKSPAILVLIYWSIILSLGGFRSDHLMIGLLILVLWYTGKPLRKLFNFLLPLILTGIIYDSQRFYSDYIRGPVHVAEPYNLEKFLFGISTTNGLQTPNEWFQLHTNAILDLITGLAYIIFVPVFVITAACFSFYLSRKGTKKFPANKIATLAPAVMWSFFWVNMVGFSTYYWYAAAPPWYVALYGLGPARMDATANAAGCVRFDQILGTHFFDEWYGRSADVFGAIPSLHVAYPLIAVFFAFKFGALRTPSVLFYLIMCFAAVYLNHHYIIDVILGTAYGLAAALILNWCYERKNRIPT